METSKYEPKNKVRIVTAASLFDGHDAAINIMPVSYTHLDVYKGQTLNRLSLKKSAKKRSSKP